MIYPGSQCKMSVEVMNRLWPVRGLGGFGQTSTAERFDAPPRDPSRRLPMDSIAEESFTLSLRTKSRPIDVCGTSPLDNASREAVAFPL